NSFRSLERAIEYEADRQIGVLDDGGTLVQETRHWDEEAGVTHSMRTKEGSSDYRYFTEPDLVPMVFDRDWVESVRERLPELPAERRKRYADLGLDPGQVSALSAMSAPARTLFDDAVAVGAPAPLVSNWVTGEIAAYL